MTLLSLTRRYEERVPHGATQMFSEHKRVRLEPSTDSRGVKQQWTHLRRLRHSVR